MFLDVNITGRKVNDKNPLEVLIKRPVSMFLKTGFSCSSSPSIN
jgi:hypothetical protein